jgi:hypothetical protein
MSLHLDQWKAMCKMSDVIDDLLTSHWKSTSRVAIPYRRRRLHHQHGTLRLCSYQKAVYSRRWMDLPSYQERCGFTPWRMERTEKTIPLLEEREPELRQIVSLYRTDL